MENNCPLLRNSLGQENLMLIACDGPLPKECLPDIL